MKKMPENRKPPTDFTIDCILSKNDSASGDLPRSPTNHPMNKVLDNPWISKCPLALTFKPSNNRKINIPPSPITPILQPHFFNIFNPPTTINFTENVKQNFTTVHNHFYRSSSASESTSNSDDFKLLPKFDSLSSEEKSSSDSDTPSDSLSSSEHHAVDLVMLSPKTTFKCSVCSKSFDNCELLDVG
jgi:hypothetical protein